MNPDSRSHSRPSEQAQPLVAAASPVTRQLLWIAGLVGLLCFGPSAFAAVKLVNKDSKSHDLKIKCSSGADTSIGASSTRDLGNGPCTVTVKQSGSTASASGNETLTIKDGKVSK